MAVTFKASNYYKAAGNAQPAIKNRIQFSYGSVTRISFNQAYDAQKGQLGQVTRKLSALPSAMISVARMVANLGYMIFVGIPFLCAGNVKRITSGAFHLIRNGEMFAGKLIGIFNDRLGQYHIQKGRFQKTCYDLCVAQSSGNTSEKEKVEAKSDRLIAKFYNKDNPQLILQEFEKTFKSHNDIQVSGEHLLDHIAKQQDHEFIESLSNNGLMYFDHALRDLTQARIYFEKGMYEKAIGLAKKHNLFKKEAIDLQIQCAERYIEQGKTKEAISIIELLPISNQNQSHICAKMAEKLLDADQLEEALRIEAKILFPSFLTDFFFTKLIGKCLDNDMLLKGMQIAQSKLSGNAQLRAFVRCAQLLIKDPLFEKNTGNLTKLATTQPHLLVSLAATLLNSGDELHAKRAISMDFTIRLLKKHFPHPWLQPNQEESKKIEAIQEKLLLQTFATLKHELITGNLYSASALIQKTVSECYESPKAFRAQQKPFGYNRANDAEDFFNNFFNNAQFPFFNGPQFGGNPFFFRANFPFGQRPHFNRGNPFAQGANFHQPAEQKIIKMKVLDSEPKNPALNALYSKCLASTPGKFHELFGLQASFTSAELTRASRQLLLKSHPDKHPNESAAANEITAFINSVKEELALKANP